MKPPFYFLLFWYWSLRCLCISLHSSTSFLDTPSSLTPLSRLPISSSQTQNIDFSTFKDSLQSYNLTQGETRTLFRLCDHNHDDKLTGKEWDTCVSIFVLPYEKNCLKSTSNYLMAKTDLEACLKKDLFKDIPPRTTNNEKPTDAILQALLRDVEGKMNLMDYIFLRRVTLAWKECSVDDRLNRKRMHCALAMTTHQKRKFLPISNQVFNIGIQLYKTKVKELEAFLDFFSFAKIAYLYNYFNELGLPFQAESLTKNTLRTGIEDQILPTSLTVEWVDRIFYALDPEHEGNNLKLNFGGFAALIHCSRLYRTFAERKKSGSHFFTESSFKKMVMEHEFEYFYSTLINMISIVEEDFKSENNTQSDASHDERSYFVRFAQKNVNSKKKVDKYKVIYKMFDAHNNSNWNFTELVYFVKLTWTFQAIDVTNEGLIYRNDVSNFLSKRSSILPLTNSDIKTLDVILSHLKSDPLNAKQFYSFFVFKQIFSKLSIPGHRKYVTIQSLKEGLNMLALKSSNDTLAVGKEVYTDIQKVPMYNYEKAFFNAIKEELKMLRQQQLGK